MGYAPVSIIDTAPVPAESGTEIYVPLDCGDRFPKAPFTYLAWPVQTIPNLGVDSETGTVTAVNGDHFTIERSDNAVALEVGMQFAAVGTVDIYSIEEEITLSQEFPNTDTGVALNLRSPGGAVGRYEDALTQEASAGGSAFSLTFAANEGGLWHYEFVSGQRVFDQQDFFVRFDEVH